MPKISILSPILRTLILIATFTASTPAAFLYAQDATRTSATTGRLTLTEAREAARLVSPDIVAAKEAIAAAAARERQAGAFPNPTFSYQREQTSGSGQTNSQNIASFDQPIELGGIRSARGAVADLRRQVAEARLKAVESQIDLDVTRAYALAAAADRRAQLAQQASEAFARAQSTSQTRLVSGDVSGYSHRRVGLEATRYAGLFAEATLTRRAAHLTLASLVAPTADVFARSQFVLDDSIAVTVPAITMDSLYALALVNRAELNVSALEAELAAADARLIAQERTPVPVLSAGFKNEKAVGGDGLNGFVAGLSIPLPVWDRRKGAIEGANADVRRRTAEIESARRRVAHEIADALENFRAVDEQITLLRPQLGAESAAALQAAQVAYTEGEIPLVEWLDAVRAYQEAEATYATLRAESLIRRAALERAVGVPLSR